MLIQLTSGIFLLNKHFRIIITLFNAQFYPEGLKAYTTLQGIYTKRAFWNIIKEGFLELWKNQMKQYSEGKLRTYTTFKVHFGFENYLSVIGNFEHRRCLTKLRISAHRLHIETGRYQGIPPHQRLCEQCDSGEVEDEIHFLLCCSKFREERQQLFKTISQSCNNFLQLNPREKFYWLMTCEDVSVLKELCHFIYKYCR